MATRATLLVIVGLVAAAAAGAVYAPGQAERLVPGAGERALQARAALPAAIVERLPPARPFETKAASSARSAESAKADAPKAQPVATAPPRPPANVVVGTAARKRMEVRLDAIGSVQPIASVALRTRIDAQIDRIFVADGAAVKAGDMLIKLDSRQIEAQIKQSEAALAKDRATLDQVNRDVGRYSQLVANQAGTQIALDNAKTAVLGAQAAVMGDSAALDNLKVQLGWYSIMAPISGRVGAFTLKAGNVVRSGDNGATGTLAVINQITPIYVAFSISQRYLADLRQAMLATGAVSVATPQGQTVGVSGKVAVLDNAIDAATGTITVRSVFDNPAEALWPGQLCNVRTVLRSEDAVAVPREAVQVGQNGNFVFVVENGVARAKSVKVARIQDGESVIADGLKGGETVVVDGALLVTDGSKVEIKTAQAKKDAS